MPDPLELQMLIGGERVETRSGKRFDVLNPATEATHATVPEGGAEDVDDAVAAARKALDAWRRTSATDRGTMLRNLARALERRTDEFAQAETAQNGKTLFDSEFDVTSTVACLDYYAGAANKQFGETIPAPSGYFVYTRREPVGVCGLIVPWNFPLAIAAWKLGPALAAGNTLVLKPASETPVTALMLADLLEEADFPPGVVNIVSGPGSVAGQRLVVHPDVDKISLTGETTTGRNVMREAAETLKRVTLELGGKSPSLVFDDDVDNSMRIAREEIFGPVAAVGRFSDYDDGVAKANDTPYGLAATVWTNDLTTAHRAAEDIRAGGVWINTSEFLFNESPFGGMKASGFGRELSVHGLDAYTEVKNVGVSLGAHMPTFEL